VAEGKYRLGAEQIHAKDFVGQIGERARCSAATRASRFALRVGCSKSRYLPCWQPSWPQLPSLVSMTADQ